MWLGTDRIIKIHAIGSYEGRKQFAKKGSCA